MPRVSPEQIRNAKQYDLFTYLQCARPTELLRVTGKEFTTKTHDSLRISNGCWHWFSRGIGGKTALDYLIKVENYGFVDAVTEVLAACDRNAVAIQEYRYETAQQKAKPEKKKFELPAAASSNDRVIQYLSGRGIDREIIDLCLLCGILYESMEKHKKADGAVFEYHNAIFCGWDAAGQIRYAVKRGLTDRHFYGEVEGSDKRFGFRFGDQNTKQLAVFESAIDAMSHATLSKMASGSWDDCDRLALGGAATKATGEALPVALEKYLSRHSPDKILICLDNDKAGITASLGIEKLLKEKGFDVEIRPAPFGKDYNEYLMRRIVEKTGRKKREPALELR